MRFGLILISPVLCTASCRMELWYFIWIIISCLPAPSSITCSCPQAIVLYKHTTMHACIACIIVHEIMTHPFSKADVKCFLAYIACSWKCWLLSSNIEGQPASLDVQPAQLLAVCTCQEATPWQPYSIQYYIRKQYTLTTIWLCTINIGTKCLLATVF